MSFKIKNILRKCILEFYKITGKAPNTELQIKLDTERHGSDYGGWNIIKDSVDSNSIIYSFGIGTDISFDISLINKYDVEVYAFDPTPEVKVWLEEQKLPIKFRYHELALADINGFLKFYFPENPNYISHSLVKRNDKYIEVPCEKLSSIMNRLGHKKIDVLKIDIEGSEFNVLKNILQENINIKQILVEFHHFFDDFSGKDTENMVSEMNNRGYKIFYISSSGYEYSFLHFDNANS